MEPVNGTPNENEYKGDDIKLRVELNAALESELSKSPDEMNTEKIDSIIELLNRLDEDSSTEQEMTKDQFAEKYLKGVIKYRERGAGYFKVAIIFVGLILCVSVCNFISVRATSKSLFFLAKEKAYLFYYETFGNENGEAKSQDMIGQVQNVSECIYESWEELTQDETINILVPVYIPNGFEAMSIHMQKATEDDIGISRQYINGESHIRFLARTVGEYGKVLHSEDKYAELSGEREINGKTVFLYQTEDAMQAMFQDGQYVYILEANISEEEIIKMIEEMR
mgnify:CR=1 FL=1